MITNTFKLLPGIDNKTQENIIKQGVLTWNEFLNSNNIYGISPKRKIYYNWLILQAKKALYNQESSYFTDKLPNIETWRLYKYFQDEALFLDIETTGLSIFDKITLIGLYDGRSTKTMIRDINFNEKMLKAELKKYKLIITFNGASFDLPFIEKQFPGILPKVPHIDLRYTCNLIGLSGGLKIIEQKLNIKRKNKIVENFNGGDAVTLWRMYKSTGDDHYLKLLVEYNEEDIVNLKDIMEHCFKLLSQ